MYLKSLHIQNFKFFEDVFFTFNPNINIFTGVNNAGKTTTLEAIALWQECFVKLLMQAQRNAKSPYNNYQKNDYLLGNTQNKYFQFEEINSVRSPNFEDIFFQGETNRIIKLGAVLEKEGSFSSDFEIDEELKISFLIKSTGGNYHIVLENFLEYDFKAFNQFFSKFPNPISLSFSSPVSNILPKEKYMTIPNVRELGSGRVSMEVLRNRLSLVYGNRRDTSAFQNFVMDLNYILFGKNFGISLSEKSNIQKNSQVIFEVVFQNASFENAENKKDKPKDLALLGSGTLQIIEILLNVYYQEYESDVNMILLDEPDSHIHRDIQARMLEILQQRASKNQFFITTHNEAFIRNASILCLFHLENISKKEYKPLSFEQNIIPDKRFKGIYPTPVDSILRSYGQATGLDFMNALEADKIIFVEGKDDATVIQFLLQKTSINKNAQKNVFWVLNGISHVFKDILGYKNLFEQIKNRKTLWEKCVLVIDKDFLSDEHRESITKKMKEKLSLPTYITQAYTFEATLLSNIPLLARLLDNYLLSKEIVANTSVELQKAYQDLENNLREKYQGNDENVKQTIHRYQDIEVKLNELFEDKKANKNSIIHVDNLTLYYQNYLKNCFSTQDFYKIAHKEDVAQVINQVLNAYEISFDIEKDFLTLLSCINSNVWFEEWNFIRNLIQ